MDGDSQEEILLAGGGMYIGLIPFFAIFTYNATGWEEQFYLGWGGDNAVVRTTLLDDRLQVDFLIYNSAGGLYELYWHQFWIRCEPGRCREIWSAERYTDTWIATSEGAVQLYSIATIEEPAPGVLRCITRSISIELDPINHRQTPPVPLDRGRPTINPEVIETYQWDGEHYTLLTREESVPKIAEAGYLVEVHRQSYQTLVSYFRRPDGSVDEEALYVLEIIIP